MSDSNTNYVSCIGKAALGFGLAISLAPMAIARPIDAQSKPMLRPVQTQDSYIYRPSTPPAMNSILSSGSGDNPQPADSAGSCNGVSDCNNFIAICIGGGGEYVPGTENDEGQPTSGSCEVE